MVSSIRLSLVVCAHKSRETQAKELAKQLKARICWDDGTIGSTANHGRAWGMTDRTATWCGVIEDDAIPIPHILEELPQMLRYAPTGIVSAYLGTGRPRSRQQAIQAALQFDPTWIQAADLLHHVAVFARGEYVPQIAQRLANSSLPCDEAIGAWSRRQRIPVSYPIPSLFEHADDDTVITGRHRVAELPRKAWVLGSRDDWDSDEVTRIG